MSLMEELMHRLQSPPPMRPTDMGTWYPVIRDRVVCEDGFSMSVQASQFHYSKPRNNDGGYTEFEVGFLDAKEPLLSPYAEQPEEEPNTVYGYVPIDVIRQVIEKHGGPKQERGEA